MKRSRKNTDVVRQRSTSNSSPLGSPAMSNGSAPKLRDVARMERAVAEFLEAAQLITPDTDKTPGRVVKMWLEHLIDGYNRQPSDIIRKLSPTKARDLIVMRDIELHSVCPHHLLPYDITAHIAFLPDGYTAGFSRIAELVESRTHRLLLLEDLIADVADTLLTTLQAKGVAVRFDTRHGCMIYQGTPRRQTRVDATAMRGVFAHDKALSARVQRTLE
jgi:GTP cyclohydrolase I